MTYQPDPKIRAEVMATIISCMEDAEALGLDPMKAAEAKFPGTPTDVVVAAWLELDARKTEAWWRSIERTIDGEVVRKAIADASKGGAA